MERPTTAPASRALSTVTLMRRMLVGVLVSLAAFGLWQLYKTKMSPGQLRSVRYRVTLISGVMPTPPPMRTTLSASRPVKMKEPEGAVTSSRSPGFTTSCR